MLQEKCRPNGSPVSCWPRRMPVLRGAAVQLRELRIADASHLLAQFSTPSVLRYIAPPPSTVEGFKRFIRWSREECRRGALLCFGVVPAGHTLPVGLVQIWPISNDCSTAEWGYVL